MIWRTWGALALSVLAAAVVAGVVRRRTARSARGRRFVRHRPAVLGVAILLFFVILAVAAPQVAPYDPNAMPDPVGRQYLPPSLLHPMGTDLYSRDVWSRVVFGARVSLAVGALATLLALTVGTAVGAAAGYFRHWADAVLMRLVDVGLAVPRIFVLLVAAAIWPRLGVPALVVLIGATGWFGTSRLVRAEVLSIRERAYVDAARALGAGHGRVIFRHVLPNGLAPVIVSAALGLGGVILLEAALSYLGFGVRPPTASWGNMIRDNWEHIVAAPWASLFPGFAISLVVMAANAVGDGLRDAFDPRGEAA